MAIKFECPHCHNKLSVKDELAGKKGKCPACKKPVVIPAPTPATVPTTETPTPTPTPTPEEATPQLPTPPRLDGPERSQEELEKEALEALADEPPAEDGPAVEVVFDCPMCGEKVTFKADEAGKRAPCPECRRIITVPEPQKKTGPRDWRQLDRRPAGARVPDEPAPEGAWGTEDKRTVSDETREEFGLTRRREKPVPFLDKAFPYLAGALMLLLASLLGLGLYGRFHAGYEQGLLSLAGDYARNPKAGRTTAAALYRGTAEYHFRRQQADSAARGREQCEAALAALMSASGDTERNSVLLDVGLTLLANSADRKDPAVERGEKLPWDETLKALTTALRTMSTHEARREGVRLLGRRLIAAGQPDRALALAGLAFPPGVERAEAQAVVGLELHAAGKTEAAGRAAEQALLPYANPKPPGIVAPVVALALLTRSKPPQPREQEPGDKVESAVGEVEALAREGKVEEARTRAAQVGAADGGLRLRCLVTVAEASADTSADDVEAAARLIESRAAGTANTSAWTVYRLVHLGLRAKLPPARLREIAQLGNDAVLRERGLLLALDRELSGAKGVEAVPGPHVEKLDPAGLARLLGTEILCRHNATVNASWGDFQTWPEPQKAFGAVGVLQGRHSR